MIYQTANWQPTFEVKWIHEKGNNSGENMILDRWVSLDTETSHNHKEVDDGLQGWIYQWCFKIYDDIVIGRTPAELIDCMKRLETYCKCDDKHTVVWYVHNLSYDIQYLKWFLRLVWGQLELLAVNSHQIISLRCGPWHFKCSWKLSNKTLQNWSDDLGTEHRKLVGSVDYDAVHYQDQALTDEDWAYQINDVLAMDEAMEKQLALYGDRLNTVPLTSTGYIRRTARKNYRAELKNRKAFIASRLNADSYIACLREFAGGLTHGNRHLCGETIRVENYPQYDRIAHRDFVSHYPSQQRVRPFPIGPFFLYSRSGDFDKIKRLKSEYCVLFDLALFDPEIKSQDVIMPILSEAKARQGMISKCHFISDNGRILQCKGAFTITVTDLDAEIILKQYNFKAYQINNIYVSHKGKLPKFMIETVDNYMYGKTTFKALMKNAPDKQTKELYAMELMKAKNGLNGIYGCTAQRPVRDKYVMDDSGEWHIEVFSKEEIQQELDKFYANRNNFMRYQWGCWTTSWARFELLEFVELIQSAGGTPLYCDTDSIFYLSNEAVESTVEKRNEELRARSEELGAFIEYEGKKVYYNQFDKEDDCRAFRFLHAKCYALETMDGELEVTVAGVPAYEDATHKYSRIEELGSIENLRNGFKFVRCGGTGSKYTETIPTMMDIDGHQTEVGSACVIVKSEKTLHDMLGIYDVVNFMEDNVDGD